MRELIDRLSVTTSHQAGASLSRRLIAVAINWAPLVILSAAIYWFSSQPILGQPDLLQTLLSSLFGRYAWYAHIHGGIVILDAISSWLAHFTLYALLALMCLWAIERQWPRLRGKYALAFACAALFALSDEYHQSFVPGRHCDWRDVVTDWLGAAIALSTVILYRRRRIATMGASAIPEPHSTPDDRSA
jgi:VanZ family protein